MNKTVIPLLAAGVLSASLFAGSAGAVTPGDNEFAALRGVTAQALSAEEMQAIAGELNATDIYNALVAKAATLGQYPKLQAAVLNLAASVLANATQINNLLKKLHLYTP